ncbi:MAG: mechanosensitive ion channel family protein [Bacilli bacterium]|nr:mechanosensitive ion channel family protein [Bacilli bacterium]
MDHIEKVLVKEVVNPVLIIAITILIYGFVKHISNRIITKKMQNGDEKKGKTLIVLFNNVFKYILILIDLLMILEVYSIDTKAIIASLGVVGVVLGLALQDTLKDFLGGLFILFENQYHLGDYVTIGTFTGEVIYLGMKTTKIKAYTGEVKMISNRFITEVINHSVAHNLAIVDIAVSYQSDLQEVERILKEVCKEAKPTLKKVRGHIEVLGVQELGKEGAIFRITAPCLPMEQYGVERELRKKIQMALLFNKIEFPYDEVVVHNG